MASSHRLNKRLALTFSIIVLLASAAAATVIQAWREGEALSKTQLETLLRARWSELEARDYRSFIEGLGFEFRDVYLVVDSPEGKFEVGLRRWPRVCASREYLVGAQKSKALTVSLCRGFDSPVLPLFLIVLVTLSVTILIVLMTRREAVLLREAALSDLVKRVVHDLRSPLFIVQSMASSLAAQSQNENSTILKSAADRLGKICEDLLQEHRHQIQSGHTSDSNELRDVIDLKIREVKERFLNLKIDWKIDLDQSLKIPLRASDAMRVLSNVINNSVEASAEGNLKIQIKTSLLRGRTLLTVTDDGPGINSELLQEFYKNGFRSSGKSLGNGLGLKSVQSLIQKSGGTMMIYSEPGLGTTVEFAWTPAGKSG